MGIQAGLQHFNHPGGAHAAADAHGDAHAFGTSAFAFDQYVPLTVARGVNIESKEKSPGMIG